MQVDLRSGLHKAWSSTAAAGAQAGSGVTGGGGEVSGTGAGTGTATGDNSGVVTQLSKLRFAHPHVTFVI